MEIGVLYPATLRLQHTTGGAQPSYKKPGSRLPVPGVLNFPLFLTREHGQFSAGQIWVKKRAGEGRGLGAGFFRRGSRFFAHVRLHESRKRHGNLL